MPGVSLHRNGPRGGRHAASGGAWKEDCFLAAAVPIGAAIGVAAVVIILAASLGAALRKATVALWGRMGPTGQLAAQAAGCMTGGSAAGDLGIIPGGTLAPAALGAGGVIGLVVMHRRRAHRQRQEWAATRGRGRAVRGTWEDYAASHEAVSSAAIARIGEHEKWLAEHDARFEAVFAIMREAAEAAGLCAPADRPRPKLTVITNHHYQHGA